VASGLFSRGNTRRQFPIVASFSACKSCCDILLLIDACLKSRLRRLRSLLQHEGLPSFDRLFLRGLMSLLIQPCFNQFEILCNSRFICERRRLIICIWLNHKICFTTIGDIDTLLGSCLSDSHSDVESFKLDVSL